MSGKKKIKVKKIVEASSDINAQKKIEEMKAQDQLDYGIVLCGGATRGAFQLGVWKKLEELGVAERFTGFSSASVGALNAILFTQGDYQKAVATWMEMKQGDLMQPNEVLWSKVLVSVGMGKLPAEQVISILANWSENFGLVSRKKLGSIVRDNITSESLKDKLIYVSLSVLRLRIKQTTRKREHIMKLKYPYLDPADSIEENINKVLASAAFPVAFTPVKVGGKNCIDGGAMDNAPVYPLIKAGYRKILVVHLKRRWKKNGKDRQEIFNKRLRKGFSEEELEGVTICHIWPQRSLKNKWIISPKLTQRRIDAGYEAASDQIEANFFQ